MFGNYEKLVYPYAVEKISKWVWVGFFLLGIQALTHKTR